MVCLSCFGPGSGCRGGSLGAGRSGGFSGPCACRRVEHLSLAGRSSAEKEPRIQTTPSASQAFGTGRLSGHLHAEAKSRRRRPLHRRLNRHRPAIDQRVRACHFTGPPFHFRRWEGGTKDADGSVPRQQHEADFRRRHRRPGAGHVRLCRRQGRGMAGTQPERHSARRLLRPGADQPLRNVPSRRRPHDQDADGPGRGVALGLEAGQLLQQAGEGARRCGERRRDQDLDGPGDSADGAAQGHGAGEVPSGAERSPHDVLGPPDVPRRNCVPAAGLGLPPQRALSRARPSRTLPERRRQRRLARDAARRERARRSP
jgi:hypothetical protein